MASSAMNSGPFGQTAKKYRDNGWLGTLPLPPRLKEAPPGGYTGHGAPYPSASKLANWLSRNKAGNICLRLGEVPNEFLPDTMPAIYGGNNVDGWELIGLDVDAYGDKNGDDNLRELTDQLGELPATATSSSRWSDATDDAFCSGVRVFLVPKGFKYKGKAHKHIDILYTGLRYMVAAPSIHPSGNEYGWRYGPNGDADHMLWRYLEDDMPAINEDVAVLPVAWFNHLKTDSGNYSADTDLTAVELWDWLGELSDSDNMCALMQRDCEKYCSELEASDSHHPLNTGVWRLVMNAVEGHRGIHEALNTYVKTWMDDVIGDKRDMDSAHGEVNRNVSSAIAKAKNIFEQERNGVLPECTCAANTNGGSGTGADSRAGKWADKFDSEAHIDKTLNAGDGSGMGPIIGRMSVSDADSPDKYMRNDRGNAKHFIDLYGESVKYVDSRKNWVLWDGNRWHRDFEDKLVGQAFERVERRQRQYAASIAGDSATAKAMQKTWHSWSLRSGNAAQIKNALSIAKTMSYEDVPVALSGREFDANPALMGCSNGTLELTDDPDVRPPAKHDYVTYNTHTDYVPWRELVNAEGEAFTGWQLWTEYLDKFLPDKELQRFVQKVMGSMLIGGNPDKLLVFLFGDHDTGKSTMLGAVAGALGDYYGTISMKLFKEQDLNPGLVRAVPLRVTAMSEVDAGAMDGATVKRLTGNDRVTAELKYSNEIFEGTPQFTTVIACNNPPNIKHADEALMERLLVLPFATCLPRAERKYERQKEIEYHSGVAVLSWLVEGWKLYCAEGLKRATWPAVVRRQNNAFGAGLNTTQMFINDNIIRAKDTEDGRRAIGDAKRKAKKRNKQLHTVIDMPIEWTPSAGGIYQLYIKWCNQNGVQAVNHPELTRDIGVGRPQIRKVEGKAVKCYVGIRLRQNGVETGGFTAR